jgi:hypothetical protein
MESEKCDDNGTIYVSEEAYEYMVTMENELMLIDKLDGVLQTLKQSYIDCTNDFDKCTTGEDYTALQKKIETSKTDNTQLYNKYIVHIEQKEIAHAIAKHFKDLLDCNTALYESIENRKVQSSYLLIFLQSLVLIISLGIGIYSMVNAANGSMKFGAK